MRSMQLLVVLEAAGVEVLAVQPLLVIGLRRESETASMRSAMLLRYCFMVSVAIIQLAADSVLAFAVGE